MRRRCGYFCVSLKYLRMLAFASSVVAFSGATARAGFLEDIFGGPDPAPQAASPGRAERGGYAAARQDRSARRDMRVKSEVHFMSGSGARAKDSRDHHERSMAAAGQPDNGKASAGGRPVTAALCAPEATVAGASASALLAYDKTLRSGDIMVTDSGLKVFRGHAACPHDARDFLALSSTNMPKAKRSVLLAIEETMKRPSGYVLAAKYEKQ
jgi:hypothetical protein